MSDNYYAQSAINGRILAEEKAQRETRLPSAFEELAEEVDRLRREFVALRSQQPAFNGAAFGKEIVKAVKGYVDPALDRLHERIDKAAEDAVMGDRRTRLNVEEMVHDLRSEMTSSGSAAASASASRPCRGP